MIDSDRSLRRVLTIRVRKVTLFTDIPDLEVDLDDDFKLAPASLSNLVGRFCHGPVGIGITVVQLEVHLLHVGRHVLQMRK